MLSVALWTSSSGSVQVTLRVGRSLCIETPDRVVQPTRSGESVENYRSPYRSSTSLRK